SRTASFFADVRARRRQAANDQREPPGGGEGAGVLEVETGRLETVAHQALKVLRGTRLHAGRNFLAQQFEKKLGHFKPPLSSALRAMPRSTLWQDRVPEGCSSGAR